MHIKRAEDRKKHNVLDNNNEEHAKIRPLEEVLGEDELVEDINNFVSSYFYIIP